jgi:hypothetical protein
MPALRRVGQFLDGVVRDPVTVSLVDNSATAIAKNRKVKFWADSGAYNVLTKAIQREPKLNNINLEFDSAMEGKTISAMAFPDQINHINSLNLRHIAWGRSLFLFAGVPTFSYLILNSGNNSNSSK